MATPVNKAEVDLIRQQHTVLENRIEKLWFGLAASLMLDVCLLLLMIFGGE